ncbi:MAG: prepilin peptidase [Planctomycetota bacterium]|nr:MAG: prepilin peptidase [Planctomycetota bacterium]
MGGRNASLLCLGSILAPVSVSARASAWQHLPLVPEQMWTTTATMLAALIGGIFGAFIGSYLGVIAHRVPRGQSIVRPPSHCSDCGTILRWNDNIPILGWLLLRGRCRWCGARIPLSVWLIEVVTAALTATVCWWVFTHPEAVVSPLALAAAYRVEWLWLAPLLASVALLVAVWVLLVCTLTDLQHMIIPDELSKPMQVLAPFLALMLSGSLVDEHASAYLLPLFASSASIDGTSLGMWTFFDGVLRVLLILVGALALLLISLPLARWIYGTRLRGPYPWRDQDHRAFAVGAWWFVIALIPAMLLLAIAGTMAEANDMSFNVWAWMVLLLTNSLLGCLAGWYLPYLVGLFGSWAFARNAMGYGDVKMLAWMGAFLGPVGVLYTFFIASVYGSLIGIPMRLFGGGREIPFGPYLVLGGVTAFLAGPTISATLLPQILGP